MEPKTKTETKTKTEIILSGPEKHNHMKIEPLTPTEIRNLKRGQTVLAHTGYYGRNRLNGIVHVKINGKPKWKHPNNVKVPIKYGLYEYTTITYTNGQPDDPNLYLVKKSIPEQE